VIGLNDNFKSVPFADSGNNSPVFGNTLNVRFVLCETYAVNAAGLLVERENTNQRYVADILKCLCILIDQVDLLGIVR
jgi:hypothetical protein